MSKRVLLIEDDPNLVELLELHLRDIGCEVRSHPEGGRGLDSALQEGAELMILDLTLPDMDGLEVCRKLREGGSRMPVLMLTSRSEELDKVLGLELGADDYLTKPFGIGELTARVKALLRRGEYSRKDPDDDQPSRIRFGELLIDREKRKLHVAGEPVELTAKEFDLLWLFATNPGRSYSRANLLDRIWGYQFQGYEHTVNTHISRLRGKIEKDPSKPVYLKTVWGIGYRFAEPEEVPS